VIPDDVVDRVREATDIVAIVGEFVKLKRVGSSYRGPCPFHHGKNPNFSVTDRGYNCFKCGESGDVFSFVQKHLGMDFVEAVKWVGARAGVEVHDVARRDEARDTREPLWEVNAAAADFFRRQLLESAEANDARDYLASRDISLEQSERFGLGYAPRDGSMRAALAALGFDDQRQLAAGVLVASDDRPEPRPRFRGRLMFPIHDISGHVVGFGGRVLGAGRENAPKYLNSGESPVFSKGTLLYGLHWAKPAIRKAERAIIVEGYFDAIRLMLAGIDEVVAPLGTALTPEQAALLHKYTHDVFLLYDSDQAGLKATFRAGDKLVAAGHLVRVITLPKGEDPDTFVAKHGAAGFERVAAESIDVFDRKIQILERGGWFADLRRKREALDKLIPTIRAASDPVLRDMYVTRASERTGVPRDTLVREVDAAPRERREPREAAPAPAPRDEPMPARRGERRTDHRVRGGRAERELLRMLLHQRRFIENVAERIGPEMLSEPVYRDIFRALTGGDPDRPIDEIVAPLDEEATAVVQELVEETGGIDRAEETIGAGINALLARGLADRLSEIDRLLPLAPADDKDALIREKTRLAAEMQALGRPRWKHFNAGRM
jgi:DNA primase